ncbi:elongation factor P 5-aminopentanone reductase [Latilactobacillus fuchuensis]|uniref:3-oxoacyl ACP reductase n=1 Tax=Latilactobacillus fuchuensis TaxID=164393 RepID=A0A2N9DU58_9LACO|nr:SDR family oxidoreductase [Latilactobacillus fuchuensis]SPC37544.1 3-oxoacyl ACP reductase [Latilactobacillus fuchuensis]
MRHSALVIGASGDIGMRCAQRLAKAGWSLYLHYYQNGERIGQLQQQLSQEYPQQDFLTCQLDLTAEPAVIRTAIDQLFQVDAVIFAAGMTTYGLLDEIPVEAINRLWLVHVQTPIQILQQLQTKLAQSDLGRIVFIGSIYGGRGSAMEVPYSTVKGAQSAFVNAYAQEVGTLGMTVNVVAPGAVATKMNQQFTPEEQQAIAADIPNGAFATTDQIAYWVQSLLAPEADYLTGQTLYVNGGWLK